MNWNTSCGDCRHYEAISKTEGICNLMIPVIPMIVIDAQDSSCEMYEE